MSATDMNLDNEADDTLKREILEIEPDATVSSSPKTGSSTVNYSPGFNLNTTPTATTQSAPIPVPIADEPPAPSWLKWAIGGLVTAIIGLSLISGIKSTKKLREGR